MAKRVPHSIAREKTASVAEHEILLSFHDDDGAIAFHEWWRERGGEEFAEWCSHFSDWQHVVAEKG
jgi:hypothetical protein